MIVIQTHKGQATEQVKDTEFYSGIVKVRADVTRQQVDRNFVRVISLEDDSRFRLRPAQDGVKRVVLAEYFAVRTPYYRRAEVSGFSINNGIDCSKIERH